jgi:FemAB-related protein (PEP-CTERM system-associated)
MSAQPVMHAADVAAETCVPLKIRPHEPADDAAWDAYASAHPGYTIYHGRAFHDAVAEAFGKPSHGLIAEDEAGRIVGVLPLIRQKSGLFGDRLVSLPYANHGGPLASTPEIARGLFDAAVGEAARLGAPRLEVRDHHQREIDWPTREDKVLMTLPLSESSAALDKSLGAKVRSQCRRAQREGAEVVYGGGELIPEFYQVFAVNMRDLGTPVYPRRWFEVLARHFGGAMRLVVVRLHGRPAAGCVLMRWGDTMEIPWAASDRDLSRYAPNMLLYREALDFAIDSGCRAFDFGRSTRGSGPHRFKQQWGAYESQIWWREYPRSAAPGRISELVRNVWTRLPTGVTNSIGPRISANLPW